MLLWRCAVHITCRLQHKFVYFVSPSLRCSPGSLPATVNQTQTPTSTLADLFSSFSIIKNLWIFDYKNGWLNAISVGLKSFDAFHLPLRLDGSNAVFNFVYQSSKTSALHLRLWRSFLRMMVKLRGRLCLIISTWTPWALAWATAVCRYGTKWPRRLGVFVFTQSCETDCVTWTILTATLQCQ